MSSEQKEYGDSTETVETQENINLSDEEIVELNANGIYPEKVRSGRYSAIMSTMDEMDMAARIAADIIDDKGRKPLSFAEFIREFDPNFVPDCDFFSEHDLYLDPGESSSKQSGRLTADQLRAVAETKMHCNECPLKNECLSISFTGVQITRTVRRERVLPGTEDRMPLVLDEYLIFGGYTPRERKIIYEKTCDILESRDRRDNKWL